MKIQLCPGDCFDLKAISKSYDSATRQVVFGTELYVEVPKDCVAIISPLENIKNTLLEPIYTNLSAGWHQVEVRFGRGPRPFRNYEVGDVVARMEVKKYEV